MPRAITEIAIAGSAAPPMAGLVREVSVAGRMHVILSCERCASEYRQQKRVFAKAVWPSRCPTCRNADRPKCGCGKQIWPGYEKCKSCAHTLPRPSCGTCGKGLVSRKALSCRDCHNKNQNKGKSRERTLFNVSVAWRTARQACFVRDGFTCQTCKKTGGFLHAHHVKSYRDHPGLRLDVSNLKTLCKGCHLTWHGLGKGGRDGH